MIGVITKESEKDIAREFFELFKTPWSFYKDTDSYEVILVAGQVSTKVDTKILIIYGSEETEFDRENNVGIKPEEDGDVLQFGMEHIPVYGKIITFAEKGIPFLTVKGEEKIVGFQLSLNEKKVLRIGFDLFQEINHLLSSGQPEGYALYPTLELHIAMLRSLILNSGIHVTEVLPVPAGYNFAVCLTHDVDFAGIRRHKFDHTLLGFMYRAIFISLIKFVQKKISLKKILKNWLAVLSLPFIYLGFMKDFWYLFARYIEIEKGLHSTFFVIASKNNVGQDASGEIQKKRTARYDINDIRDEVKKLSDHGCEIGLHGVDAWRNVEKGLQEKEKVSCITGRQDIGVRMHWLYLNEDTPAILDSIGFLYDSTYAYNNAVGFRTGTTQVFCPPKAHSLLELPLHIMDTAMFASGHMNLSESQAMERVHRLIMTLKRYGGVLTINWHHRSLGPERFWDDFYIHMLKILKMHNVWFTTGTSIVRWFEKRRSVRFNHEFLENNQLHVSISANKSIEGPAFILRIHKPTSNLSIASAKDEAKHMDMLFSSEYNGTFKI